MNFPQDINLENLSPPKPSNIVSMAVLFRVVKHQRELAERARLRHQAFAQEGVRGAQEEVFLREQNLRRMRDQTKSQVALSMGMSPVMMGGGAGPQDPTVAAHILQASLRNR